MSFQYVTTPAKRRGIFINKLYTIISIIIVLSGIPILCVLTGCLGG